MHNRFCWHIELRTNARLMPMDRGSIYEETIDYALHQLKIGEVTGGGTSQFDTGEISGCDVEISLYEKSEEHLKKLKSFLEFLGVPKGSVLISDGKTEQIGDLEGLALYLNGTELEKKFYESCDVNYVISEIVRLSGTGLKYYSYWEGPKETALYFYGKSFAEIQKAIMPFVETYPLCGKCRIIQIA